MCNLYSVTTNQEAIRRLFSIERDLAGNLPPLPGIFPDYMAPVIRYGRYSDTICQSPFAFFISWVFFFVSQSKQERTSLKALKSQTSREVTFPLMSSPIRTIVSFRSVFM